jgi:radical SAM protein with 4Fe4S-binding SPASM domain
MIPLRVRREANAIIWQNRTGALKRAPMNDDQYAILVDDSDADRRKLLESEPHLSDILDDDGRLLAAVTSPLGPPYPKDCLSGPLRCYLGIEPGCNLRCIYCGPRDFHSLPQPAPAEFERLLIREIANSGAFQVQLTGGEICLRGWRLIETFDEIAALNLSILISTNGVWDHIKNPEAFARELAKYPIVQMKVSIEGNEELHDRMRGQGTYQKAVHTLYLLADHGLPVRINTTVFKSSCNETQLRHLVKLAKETGAALQAIPIRLAGRASDLIEEMPSAPQLAAYTQLATQFRQELGIRMTFNFDIYDGTGQIPILDPARPVSCAAGLWGLHITHTGEVYPCGFAIEMGNERFLAGKLSTETSLQYVWRESDVFRDWRLAGKPAQCQQCEHYRHGCWGGCCVSAWAATGQLAGMDPYCPLAQDE